MTRASLGLFICAALAPAAHAAELVDALPVTERIVLLHMDEGHVQHHGLGQPRNQEVVVIDPLDVVVAQNVASYSIRSSDDAAFAQGLEPLRVGRKSKGTDFAWLVENYIDGMTVNHSPDHTKEHWLYLVLPRAMQAGKSYTITSPVLKSPATVRFDAKSVRNEAIHVNQVGYLPNAPKFGFVHHWMGDMGGLDLTPLLGRRWEVLSTQTGKVAASGIVVFRAPRTLQETYTVSDSPTAGNFQNADVAECDFSELETPGAYVLSVEGMGCSFPFEIGTSVYAEPYRMVGRALYHNRSGIALTEPFTKYTRPAPHHPKLTPGFAGKLRYTSVKFYDWGVEGGIKESLEAGMKGPLESFGWYQDAGDWDGYPSHLRVPIELLLAFELAPKGFKDGDLNLPESGNGLPDILDEAAWLARYCHRLRHELLDKGYGTGGLGLRVAGDAFGGDGEGRGSWQDVDRVWAVSGEDPVSTLGYAGVAANLAYALSLVGKPDPERVDWAKEAREAYDWALAHSDERETGMARDNRVYAAASLFRLTGEAKYHDQLAKDWAGLSPTVPLWGESAYGAFIYALGSVKGALADQVRAAVLATADEAGPNTQARRAMRWGGNFSFPMLVGQQTTPWILECAVGYRLTAKSHPARAAVYLGAVTQTCDYTLGTNANNMTYVTQLGERHPEHIFHMDAWYNGKGEMHPGLIPYGQWRKEKELGNGPWDQAWGHKTVYPAGIDNWPGAERFFDNRCSPMGAEFTVHQNLGPAAAIFGFLHSLSMSE